MHPARPRRLHTVLPGLLTLTQSLSRVLVRILIPIPVLSLVPILILVLVLGLILIRPGAATAAPLPKAPLADAAERLDHAAVRALLDRHADVQAPQPDGMTALHWAARLGDPVLVRQLLKAGAQAGATNGYGVTPLSLAWVRKPNRGDGDDGDPAPTGSGDLGSLQMVRSLIAHGADPNARLKAGRSGRGILTHTGATPFLLAAATADLPYLKLLVELGADPRIGNADGCTPLMAAAGVGTIAPGEEAGTEAEAVEAVELTLTLGANVNAVDSNGETAMHGAAYKSLPRVVELLAARGAQPDLWNRTNRHGWTPLRIAEGHRVGNFKPSAETLAALEQALHRSVPPPHHP